MTEREVKKNPCWFVAFVRSMENNSFDSNVLGSEVISIFRSILSILDQFLLAKVYDEGKGEEMKRYELRLYTRVTEGITNYIVV